MNNRLSLPISLPSNLSLWKLHHYNLATTLVNNKAAEIIDGAPTSLNTLNKLATAIANNPTFYDTMLDLLATKIDTTAALSLLATKLDVATATTLLAAKLNISDAALTYLTQSSASSTYLTQSSASSTYAPLANPTFTGLLTANNLKISSQLSMPVATVTQTGGITSPVTINAFAGTINLFSFNVPAYPGIYSYGFTVNNTYCSAGDIVLISAQSSFVVYGVTFISSNSLPHHSKTH